MNPDQTRTLTIHLNLEPLEQIPLTAAYLAAGEGAPLLMLHGFLGEKACWLPLIEQLKSHFHCISLDLLGFGASAKPNIRYNISLEIAFVRQVVAALQLENFYIIGHSFGSWVAAAYALEYGNSVAGLFLTAPAGIRDDSFCGRYNHLLPILWKTPVVDWALQLAQPWAKLTGKQQLMAQICWMRQELMANPAALSYVIDRQRPEDAIDTVEKDIHRLNVPTLVIAAEADETIPLWHSETYANEIPGAQLQIVAGADHSLPQKHPTELAQAIQQFLQHQSLPKVDRDRP